MSTRYITNDGDTVDRLCWQHYGRQNGAVEAVLAANPHLLNRPVLTKGITVILPTLSSTEAVKPARRLWS